MSTPTFRSTNLRAVAIGFRYDLEWEFHSKGEPEDLTAYSAIVLVVYDSANAQVDTFTLTALTTDADKTADSDGNLVANKASLTFLPSGTAGDYFMHVVGTKGGNPYQLGQPAKVAYYAGPPSS